MNVDITDPRVFLQEPELAALLFPCTEEFMKSQDHWKASINDFVSNKLVANIDTFKVTDALLYVKSHGIESFVEEHLQDLVRHLARCVVMDPIVVDGALDVIFAWLACIDHRIVDGPLRFKGDQPAMFVNTSGGGKSPFLIGLLLQ